MFWYFVVFTVFLLVNVCWKPLGGGGFVVAFLVAVFMEKSLCSLHRIKRAL